jgi:DNA-binding GntR family transcriptional regulator
VEPSPLLRSVTTEADLSRQPAAVNHPTVRQVVTDRLRAMILRGDLQAGSALDENALANLLGVSRTPLREAIQRLDDEGLVETIPRRGAYVKALTVKDAIEVAELREVLEAFAFRKAAPVLDDEDIARVRELHEAYRRACLREDAESAIQADVAFHDYVIQRSGNDRLREFTRRLSLLMLALRLESRISATAFGPSRDDHLPLVEALATRDPDVAEQAIRGHIRNTLQEFQELSQSAQALPQGAQTAPSGGADGGAPGVDARRQRQRGDDPTRAGR